jgi:hypothetical protein
MFICNHLLSRFQLSEVKISGRDTVMPKACQLNTLTHNKCRFPSSFYPPRIPLKKGDEREDSFPTPYSPDAKQAPGDRTLIVKQPTGTTFDVFFDTKKGKAVFLLDSGAGNET